MTTDSRDGSLLGRFFQLGYISRDLDGAIARFAERWSPVEFQVVPGQEQYPHTRRIALGYLGPVMIEIIEPDPEVPSIYVDSIPENDEDVRFHHTGHLVEDYAATLQRLQAAGYDVPFTLTYGTAMDCCYADVRHELGHYVEYVRLGEEGKAWFSSVPGFTAFS